MMSEKSIHGIYPAINHARNGVPPAPPARNPNWNTHQYMTTIITVCIYAHVMPSAEPEYFFLKSWTENSMTVLAVAFNLFLFILFLFIRYIHSFLIVFFFMRNNPFYK